MPLVTVGVLVMSECLLLASSEPMLLGHVVQCDNMISQMRLPLSVQHCVIVLLYEELWWSCFPDKKIIMYGVSPTGARRPCLSSAAHQPGTENLRPN